MGDGLELVFAEAQFPHDIEAQSAELRPDEITITLQENKKVFDIVPGEQE